MIPAFTDGLNLPVGGHRCSVAELESRFVTNDRRRGLFHVLLEAMRLAKRCGFLHALLGGSFPTGKEMPSDIDVTWFCKPGTEKTTVDPDCIQIMEDTSSRANFQYIPFNTGTGPEEWAQKMEHWCHEWGFDAKTRGERGVLLISLDDEDPRIH